MKIQKDKLDKRWYLYFGKDSFIHIENDWRQFWDEWNWYTFHMVYIYFEKDMMMEDLSGYEFIFMVLGLGFRIRINAN